MKLKKTLFYSRRRLYQYNEDDFQFHLFNIKLLKSMDIGYTNMDKKRSCQFEKTSL